MPQAAGPCEGSKGVRRQSDKPREGGVDMAKGRDRSLKTLPALIHGASIALPSISGKLKSFPTDFKTRLTKN